MSYNGARILFHIREVDAQMPYRLTLLCWLTVWIYWMFSSRGTKKTVAFQQGLLLRAYTRASAFLSLGLVMAPIHGGWLALRLMPREIMLETAGVACCLAGLSFALWARHTLGRNWSGAITLKEGHELIQTGPYAIVRHPIYAGFLLGMFGTAVALGELRGALAFGIMAASFTRKMYDEERVMNRQFPEAYPEYCSRVRKLVPFVF